jgi:hypothetical protein
MTVPEPTVRVDRYAVSCVDERHPAAPALQIYVEDRGNNYWAVLRGRLCLSMNGEWDWEHVPSERGDEWKREHRFGRDTAKALAQKAAVELYERWKERVDA